jgi:hypothetical protein
LVEISSFFQCKATKETNHRGVSRRDLQSLSAYFEVSKERPAQRDEDQQIKGSVIKRFSQQVDWRIKWIQSASGLANQEGSIGKWTGEQCSIDKWIGGHQESSVKEQRVQSASGSVNVSSSDYRSKSKTA